MRKHIDASLLAAAALAMSAAPMPGESAQAEPLYSRGTQSSGYRKIKGPDMNGARECARRRRQIIRGTLAVPYEVWIAAVEVAEYEGA